MRHIFLLAAFTAYAAPDPTEHFELKIRPLLANRCFGCHSTAPLGGLTMTSRNGLLKGGKTGPAVIPGNPGDSLLIQAIEHTNDKMKMPMGQGKMPDAEIAVLKQWIKDGAFWPEAATPTITTSKYLITPQQRKFWAWQPLANPTPPPTQNTTWAKTPLDKFILAKLEEKKLQPNAPADRRSLIRRASIDLTGLPPTYEETQAFLNDKSPEAFAKVVDRLLASPRYGERWARYWLDVARYADDRLDSDVELPYPNSFRYRDWVIESFNKDLPYNTFVKAQIAGDQLQGQDPKLAIGLGFYGLSPELTDDRVDATTRGFLGLTAACAQCHDHKFDPIPTKDYYALQGIFSSTKRSEFELAPAAEVKAWKDQDKKIQEVKKRIEAFLHNQASTLAEALAAESPRYIRAVRKLVSTPTLSVKEVASSDQLDEPTLSRWLTYLKTGPKDNQYLQGWRDESFNLSNFRKEALSVLVERKAVDEKNLSNKATNDPSSKGETFALPPARFYLWRDLFFSDFYGREFKQEEDGILYYGPNRGYLSSDGTIERYLAGPFKQYLANMRAELKDLQSALPPQYAYAHAIKDNPTPINERIQIGGVPERLGEEAPRAFLSILSEGDPKPFTQGSGRLELAEAIAATPITARVFVNRVWQHHFGEGLVKSVSNFGLMGDRPSHPLLLDALATSFIKNNWSIKQLHREIMLSATYQLSGDYNEQSFHIDPSNRLLWRANRQRLDAESMRDTLLSVSGELNTQPAGPPEPLEKIENHRRSIYGMVSRRKLDGTLALFDFPNPNLSAEQRIATASPLQQLFFLNSEFLEARAQAFLKRLEKINPPAERIRQAYRLLYGREATAEELKIGEQFLASEKNPWLAYAQVLLSSNELLFVN
ncbi:PSD1 and planctomycete cytochrome C domain-containing protein [Bryobacter aggregatus]|uniref:PSD1 and planctomycete cytochrome C domain-containing protein n=1 Tax=Bryobacter aggregatus TaxID=360054 RepID=UPI00069041F3|nr:PSD1 and planctomycete cytochrome C domain-containing protein [Bryobacter aggregatus]